LSGTQYVVGTTASNVLTIENLGTGTLSVTGATLTGANAADYSTGFTTASIAGGATANLTVNFTPTGTGSRFGTITIASDDSDEASYVINFYGIGTNNLATEPAANPTGLTFPNIKAYTFSGSFTPSANTENYLVLYTIGSAVSATPVDGTTYLRGDIIGNAKVAYVGPAVNFSPRHVIANQNYHIAVYSFNGPASFENYQTASPLNGSVTSQGNQTGNYYNGITGSNPNLISLLSTLINPHTVISYTNYKPTVMAQFEVRDTTMGRSFVVCSYTGEKQVFNDPFDWTAVGYSREHSYCHSWMPSYPADNPAKPEYSDQHNLYPVNQNKANSIRSNLPMDEITGNVVYTYMDGRAGYNGAQLVYEPRDEQKGNVARAMFYMATCYNGVSSQNWALPTNQSQATLKNWHFSDLPDNYEIARQEYIFSQQGNRNPYVDSVNFVCHVNFSNMTYDATGCNLGLNEQLVESNLVVFPVPTNGKLYVQVNGTQVNDYKIVSIGGQVIDTKSDLTADVLELNTAVYAPGTYIIYVNTPFGASQRTFIVE
jgi:endonuclease I